MTSDVSELDSSVKTITDEFTLTIRDKCLDTVISSTALSCSSAATPCQFDMWQNWVHSYTSAVYTPTLASTGCTVKREITANDEARTPIPEFTVDSNSISGLWERGTYGGANFDQFFYMRIVVMSDGAAD